MRKDKTAESIEFEFINPFTKEKSTYDYYLDSDDLIKAIKLYADFYGVNLDGTDNHIFNLFASLDSGRYEYINEVFDKVCEADFVKEKLKEEVAEKAQEEFEEEAQEEFENN